MPSNINIPEPVTKLGGKHSFVTVWRFNAEFFRLVGSICKDCGKKYYPRRWVCPKCQSRNLEDTQLSNTGTIRNAMYHYHYGLATAGYIDLPPQVFALIILDDGPMVEGEIANVSPSFIRQDFLGKTELELRKKLIGERVRAVLRRYRKIDNGNISYGLKWIVENVRL